MNTIKLRLGAALKPEDFTDISTESWRTYEFPTGKVTIDLPAWLKVSDSGGHRILDGHGVSHYIPAGWNHLYWKVVEDAPHFVK